MRDAFAAGADSMPRLALFLRNSVNFVRRYITFLKLLSTTTPLRQMKTVETM